MRIRTDGVLAFFWLGLYLGATTSTLRAEETAKPETIKAANCEQASPINQRRAHGNACGPASLLNAFQYGSDKWQKPYKAVPGTNSRSRIRYVVAAWGKRPSKHIKGAERWKPKEGVNLLDLTDMANDMCSGHYLPPLKYEILTLKDNETREKLLKRSHSRLAKSLNKGLPPIISVRRFAHRYNREVGAKSWWPIRGHFVVVTEVPKLLVKGATSFPITYVDPYGGFVHQGELRTATGMFTHSPFLSAHLPKSGVGKSFLKAGEPTALTLAAILGCW